MSYDSNNSNASLVCVLMLLYVIIIGSIIHQDQDNVIHAAETDDMPVPDSIGIGLQEGELFVPEDIGFRTENPGPFLHWPLPSSIPRTNIVIIPDSPWTHNLLGISDCPAYPPMIDDYTWIDPNGNPMFYPGQFNNYALPGTTRDRVRFLNVDNVGTIYYNFFACYGASPPWGLPDHAGTDILASNGTNVLASATADQVYVVIDGNGDFRVRLRHPNVNGTGQTWYTFYVHLSTSVYPVGTSNVTVPAGNHIGGVGQGHLHFQAAIGGAYSNGEARNIWGIDQTPWNGCLWIDTNLCASPPNSCCGCTLVNQNRNSSLPSPLSPFAGLVPQGPASVAPPPAEPGLTLSLVEPPTAVPNPALSRPHDYTPPNGNLQINGGGEQVNSLNVTLRVEAQDDNRVTKMRFSADGETWTPWQPFATQHGWQLTNQPNAQTVYAQVKDEAGNVSKVMAATVTAVLNVDPPSPASYTVACSVMGMGGGTAASGSYTVRSTIGQPYDTTPMQGTSYEVHPGFETACSGENVAPMTREVYLPVVVRP